MTWQNLDLIFPFFVLAYGAMITFVLNLPALVRLADQKLPQHIKSQMEGHRWLALICLILGGLWSLQNIWLMKI